MTLIYTGKGVFMLHHTFFKTFLFYILFLVSKALFRSLLRYYRSLYFILNLDIFQNIENLIISLKRYFISLRRPLQSLETGICVNISQTFGHLY